MSVGKLFKEGEEPALWLRAELDGGDPQVLARVELDRLDPDHPFPGEWAMGIAARRDGKLWLVGLSSAEVWLASPGGRVLRRDVLPVRLRAQADDEKAVNKVEEETLRWAQSDPVTTDPTGRQPKSVQVFAGAGTSVIGKVMSRGNDLVVTTDGAIDPIRAVLYVPADGGAARCWQVPGREKRLFAAVTEDELWWLGEGEAKGEQIPLLHIPWDELLSPPSKEENLEEAPASPPHQ